MEQHDKEERCIDGDQKSHQNENENENVIKIELKRKRRFQCSQCFAVFFYEKALVKHFEKEHRGKVMDYVCPFCENRYRFCNSLNRHLRDNHSENEKLLECSVFGVR